MRLQGRWADWAAILVGLALGISFVWHGMQGFGAGAMFVLGLGAIMAAVVSLTRPGALASELGVLASGVLVFALPWLAGFTDTAAAAWTAWILGAALAALGAFGLAKAREARRRDPDTAWTTHITEV
ncbi:MULTISPECIES: SPW repeat protein [unclassified Nocardiopsis]|uniref:SPW repeat domain-containing protein n=1 Tax=unclassified Nocardiopsis TaxID=2649073 RepID=UPI001357FD7B|nr:MULTISPECIES: SPW repeat protein [unclassified Nocardiopsis]